MQETTYVDTPKGIFTTGGFWFHTRENLLKEYASKVLEKESLSRLLGFAEVWLMSAETIVLWLFPLYLLLTTPVAAIILGLVVFLLWKIISPSIVSRAVVRVLGILENAVISALYYVVILSYLAAIDQFVAVWVGLGGFIAIRWRLVTRAFDPFLNRIWDALYSLPVNDQVLRAFIIRTAQKYRISMPEIDRMEDQIQKLL